MLVIVGRSIYMSKEGKSGYAFPFGISIRFIDLSEVE